MDRNHHFKSTVSEATQEGWQLAAGYEDPCVSTKH